MEQFSSTFPAHRKADFMDKMEQLNKKARKMKVKELTYEFSEPFEGKWEILTMGIRPSGNHGTVSQEIDSILITATVYCEQELKLEGEHTLLAVLENVDGHTFVNSAVKGKEFKEYRTNGKAFLCDHCGYKRSRKKSILIEKNGKEMVIGSTCIREYLGYNPTSALNAVSFIQDCRMFEEDGFGSERFENPPVKPSDAVRSIVTVLKETNFVYRKEQEELANGKSIASTHELVRMQLFGNLKGERPFTTLEKDDALVVKVMEHLNSIKEQMLNDKHNAISNFDYKIGVLIGKGYIEQKFLKLLTGACVSYIRRIRKNEEREARGVSEYIGNVGDKLELEVEIVRVHSYTDYNFSYYGQDKLIVSGLVNGKDKFTWFTSPNAGVKAGLAVVNAEGVEVPVEGKVKIKGTVKAQKEDPKFGKDTVLTRVTKVKEKVKK